MSRYYVHLVSSSITTHIPCLYWRVLNIDPVGAQLRGSQNHLPWLCPCPSSSVLLSPKTGTWDSSSNACPRVPGHRPGSIQGFASSQVTLGHGWVGHVRTSSLLQDRAALWCNFRAPRKIRAEATFHESLPEITPVLGFPNKWIKNPLANAGDLRHGFDPWVGKIPWRRIGQPTPVFLPGQSQGQRSLAGFRPLGRKEAGETEATSHTLADFRSLCGWRLPWPRRCQPLLAALSTVSLLHTNPHLRPCFWRLGPG